MTKTNKGLSLTFSWSSKKPIESHPKGVVQLILQSASIVCLLIVSWPLKNSAVFKIFTLSWNFYLCSIYVTYRLIPCNILLIKGLSSLKKTKCFCKFSNKHETQDSLNYVNYFRKFSFIICFQILKINNTDKKAETV